MHGGIVFRFGSHDSTRRDVSKEQQVRIGAWGQKARVEPTIRHGDWLPARTDAKHNQET